MPILDAALAFALTMLVVATVVTQIVRFMRNTAKLRNDELQDMLKEYLNTELKPVVQREANRLQKDIGDDVAKKLVDLTDNLDKSKLLNKVKKDKLIELSTGELTEQLKRSAFGEQLLTKLGDKAKAIFDELGQRYEVIGNEYTKKFREKSRYWATFIAFILALVFNIDSIHILDSYIRNEGMRQIVIAQRDAFVEDYSALVESLEKEKGKDSITKEELKQAFKDSQEQLDVLTSVGFPIGWFIFPHSGLQDAESNEFHLRNNLGGWVMWILGILLTAVLAGLGSPFWYDTVTGISRVVQSTRAVKKPAA